MANGASVSLQTILAFNKNLNNPVMKNSDPITVEQIYDASIDTVWKAITEPDQMRQWYFPYIPDFKAKVGFETKFLVQNEGRNFTHIWKVTKVIPQKLIGYSWNFDEYSGEGYSTFELTSKEDKTILYLKSEVIREFPDDIPEFKRESGEAGWNYLIGQSLPAYFNTQN